MADATPKLVVRAYVPARGWLTIAAVVLLALFGVYVTYEYGRFDAGYDRLAVGQRESEFEVAIERLEKSNRELRVKLAELETQRMGQSQERAEVSRSIGELQAQVAKQAQELAFYRGIVAQGPGVPDVKIQQLRIDPGTEPRRFRLRLTLVQPVRPENVVSGTVAMRVEGTLKTVTTVIDLDRLTGSDRRDVPFTFRYFENIDPEITLPEGFKAERVLVEVRSSRKGISPLTQTFLWTVES